jgi:hypothetical protein
MSSLSFVPQDPGQVTGKTVNKHATLWDISKERQRRTENEKMKRRRLRNENREMSKER